VIRVIRDASGHPLTIRLDDPAKEAVSAEAADEVVLMKDAAGHVIGVEILHYRTTSADARVPVDTAEEGP
jgi:hypothetical protein